MGFSQQSVSSSANTGSQVCSAVVARCGLLETFRSAKPKNSSLLPQRLRFDSGQAHHFCSLLSCAFLL